MLTAPVIVIASFAYVALLFAIAYYGDKRADAGRSIIANPYIYALSLAVYCTSWTFYGSVGRAATSGIGFLPIYLGPTLMAALWWYVMLKIIRISKQNRITSIAAFAFESLVQLLAFIAVGLFVTFWLYDGFGDIFGRAGQTPQLSALLTLGGESGSYATWASLTFLSMAAIMFLPRQFQVTVVENVDERHLTKAIWLFPLYLLAINF